MSSTSTATLRPFEFPQASSLPLDSTYLPFLLPRTVLPIRHRTALSPRPTLLEAHTPSIPQLTPHCLRGQRSSTYLTNMVFDLSVVRGRKESDTKSLSGPYRGSLVPVVRNSSPKRLTTTQGLSVAGSLRKKISKKHTPLFSTPQGIDESGSQRHRWPLKGGSSTSAPVPEEDVIIISSKSNGNSEPSPSYGKDKFEEKDYFITRYRMKHHPYPREDAPYMQAYNPILLDK
jgi:hypothetical protein